MVAINRQLGGLRLETNGKMKAYDKLVNVQV